MNSRFIVLNDPEIGRVYLGDNRYFDFAQLQKEKGRSWHSRPYEYTFVVTSMSRAFGRKLIRLDEVLDLACGSNHPGYMTIASLKYVENVVALDNDEALISNGMGQYKVFKFIRDAIQTGFEDESFDAISCVSALEHMPNWKGCIKEMHRLLKPGGMAFVTVDISTDPVKTAKHGVDDKTPADYANEFEKSGLKIFGDYDDHLPEDAVDAICSKYPLAESESELLDGQHRELKTFRMVLRKE